MQERIKITCNFVDISKMQKKYTLFFLDSTLCPMILQTQFQNATERTFFNYVGRSLGQAYLFTEHTKRKACESQQLGQLASGDEKPAICWSDSSTCETHGHHLLAELLNPTAIIIAFRGNTHCGVVSDLEPLKGFTSYRADNFYHSFTTLRELVKMGEIG